jgi:hypothetical protein
MRADDRASPPRVNPLTVNLHAPPGNNHQPICSHGLRPTPDIAPCVLPATL